MLKDLNVSFKKAYFNVIFITILPIFSLIAGLNILYPTPDSLEYKEFYNTLSDINTSDFEYGFYFSAQIAKKCFYLDYYQFIVIYIFIGLYIKFNSLLKFNNFIFIFLAYFLFIFYFHEAIVVRASFAQGIALFALTSFVQSRVKAFFFTFLAGLFHSSMFIFFIPILLFSIFDKYFSIRKAIFFLIFVSIFSYYLIDVLLLIPRFGPYFYSNPDYFNIWGLPLIGLSFLCLAYLFKIRDQLDLTSRLFLYSSTVLVSFSIIFFKLSLFSIRLMDLSYLLFLTLLISIINKKRRTIPLMLLFFFCSYLFFSKVIDGPTYVLRYLKK